MTPVHRAIREAAQAEDPVLVWGETGSGKDLVAHIIHSSSARRDGPFVAVNTRALSRDLLPETLFGRVPHSPINTMPQTGSLEEADGGVLFLDELAAIDKKVQGDLLRVIETGSFAKTEAGEPVSADVRIVAATSGHPGELIGKGRLRKDLCARFDDRTIHLPSLRERKEDIEPLARFFARSFCDRFQREAVDFSPDAVSMLRDYPWPGNVRELRNVIEQALILSADAIVAPASLPERIATRRPPVPSPNGPPSPTLEAIQEADSTDSLRSQMVRHENHTADVIPVPIGMSLADIEKAVILKTLEKAKGNKAQTAEILGISRKTLYNKMSRFGIGR